VVNLLQGVPILGAILLLSNLALMRRQQQLLPTRDINLSMASFVNWLR
jgi:hypothetical protein